MKSSSLAVIKPHVLHKGMTKVREESFIMVAHKNGGPGKIISSIMKAGYEISDLQMFHLDRVNAEEFYELYKTVVPEFHVRAPYFLVALTSAAYGG